MLIAGLWVNEPISLRLSLGLMAFNLYRKSDNDKKCILNGISRVRIDREDGAQRAHYFHHPYAEKLEPEEARPDEWAAAPAKT